MQNEDVLMKNISENIGKDVTIHELCDNEKLDDIFDNESSFG